MSKEGTGGGVKATAAVTRAPVAAPVVSATESLAPSTGSGALSPEEIKAQEEEKKAQIEQMKAETRATFEAFASDFAKLGPEGELISAAISGTIALGDAFNSTSTGMTKGLEIAGAMVSMISATMAAAAEVKVAAIDKEIAAEKKRDGQSAQSVAKMKALEAKKEAVQKKAFKLNKKMQMAQVAIAVASSIAHNIAAASHSSGCIRLSGSCCFRRSTRNAKRCNSWTWRGSNSNYFWNFLPRRRRFRQRRRRWRRCFINVGRL